MGWLVCSALGLKCDVWHIWWSTKYEIQNTKYKYKVQNTNTNDGVTDVQRAGFEVWHMTHLMVDAFKAWGRPPSNLISLEPVNNATDKQNLWWYIYSLLLLLHILCCDPSRGVLGVKVMSAMAVDWPPLDFNQESIREATWSCRSQTKAQGMARKHLDSGKDDYFHDLEKQAFFVGIKQHHLMSLDCQPTTGWLQLL